MTVLLFVANLQFACEFSVSFAKRVLRRVTLRVLRPSEGLWRSVAKLLDEPKGFAWQRIPKID
jgi:hypothetical protein